MPSSCFEAAVELNHRIQQDHINSGIGSVSDMKFPYFASGQVVKGFGRGSRELGIPTANYPEHVVDVLPDEYVNGVYYGWAQVDAGPVYKMCMSIGNNPYYNNTKRTMETHVMHSFENDFYGSNLKVVMLGYLRPMANFKCLEDLIAAIKNDIAQTHEILDKPESQLFQSHSFFTTPHPSVKL